MGGANQVKVWYDDRCGFCSFWVGCLKNGPKANQVIFRPISEAPLLPQTFDSIIVQKGERYLQLSDAAIALGLSVGGKYAFMANIAKVFPLYLRDSLYKFLAKNRQGISKACQLKPDNSNSFTPLGEAKTTASAS